MTKVKNTSRKLTSLIFIFILTLSMMSPALAYAEELPENTITDTTQVVENVNTDIVETEVIIPEETIADDNIIKNEVVVPETVVSGIKATGLQKTTTSFMVPFAEETWFITFDANGGVVTPSTKEVENGTPYGTLPTPTRTGYKFKEWNTESEGTGLVANSATIANQSRTIYAQWEAEQFKITLVVNGGNPLDSVIVQVTYGQPIRELPRPERTGYDFVGWNLDPNASGAFYEGGETYDVVGSINLFAIWKNCKYTITFDAQEGSVSPSTMQVEYDDFYLADPFPTPTRTGYEFKGWYTEPNGGTEFVIPFIVHFTEDITLYAQWDPKEYTLTYDANGGVGTMAGRTVFTREEITLLENVYKRSGYDFVCWNTQEDGSGDTYLDEDTLIMPPTDVTLYVQWEHATYELIFDACGGSEISPSPVCIQYPNTTEPLPTSIKEGYSFTEWNTAPDGSGISYIAGAQITVPSDMTLYAQWKANKYTITFDAQEGNSRQVIYNEEVGTLPTPTKEGYSFLEWNIEQDGSGRTFTEDTIMDIASDITLFAQYSPKLLSLIVEPNGGNYNGSTSFISIGRYFGSQYDIPAPTKDGFAFDSWNTQVDGSGDIIKSTDLIDRDYNFTLYAQYLEIIQIDFNFNGGLSLDTPSYVIPFIEGEEILFPTPTKYGYEISSWNTNPSGTGNTYSEGSIATSELNATTLYTIWEARFFTATFDKQNGEPVIYDNWKINTAISYLPTPSKEGHNFVGWFTEENGGGTKIEVGQIITYGENVTLYAYYEAKAISVSFFDGDQTTIDITVKYGERFGSLFPADPVAERKTFLGWYDGDTLITTDSVANHPSDYTIIAKWEEHTLEILDDFGAYPGSGNSSARIDMAHTEFVKLVYLGTATSPVEVDVASENYSISKGSTIITLVESFIKSLGSGTHYFKAVYTNDLEIGGLEIVVPVIDEDNVGSDVKTEAINQAPKMGAPKTGDVVNTNIFSVVFALGIVGLVLIMSSVFLRRKMLKK